MYLSHDSAAGCQPVLDSGKSDRMFRKRWRSILGTIYLPRMKGQDRWIQLIYAVAVAVKGKRSIVLMRRDREVGSELQTGKRFLYRGDHARRRREEPRDRPAIFLATDHARCALCHSHTTGAALLSRLYRPQRLSTLISVSDKTVVCVCTEQEETQIILHLLLWFYGL